jgi:LysM repeat protein
MSLVKAVITPEGEADIPVLFNPTQYSLNKGASFSEIAVPGLSAPILQFVRGNTRTLSMDLFFDTYEKGSDVRKYTNKIYGLVDIRGPLHRPPIVTFSWGTFNFQAVVEQVGGRFTLFLSDGTPVRATLSVTFKEFVEVDMLAKETPTESADHAKTYVVKRGDTLASIAAAEYGDAGAWREIARANRIADPMNLTPGTRLSLPAL